MYGTLLVLVQRTIVVSSVRLPCVYPTSPVAAEPAAAHPYSLCQARVTRCQSKSIIPAPIPAESICLPSE
eukprot:scaffold598617_cov15-Prasinocladus_malaysianus.AAC.1